MDSIELIGVSLIVLAVGVFAYLFFFASSDNPQNLTISDGDSKVSLIDTDAIVDTKDGNTTLVNFDPSTDYALVEKGNETIAIGAAKYNEPETINGTYVDKEVLFDAPANVPRTSDIVFKFSCPFDTCPIGESLKARFSGEWDEFVEGYHFYLQKSRIKEVPIYEELPTQLNTCTWNRTDEEAEKMIAEGYSYMGVFMNDTATCVMNQTQFTGTKKFNETYWDEIKPGEVVSKGDYQVKIKIDWMDGLGNREIDWKVRYGISDGGYTYIYEDGGGA